MNKKEKMEKKEKIFVKSRFEEKEAEEEEDNKKINKVESGQIKDIKDTQYSSEANNEEDSYGISSDNDTEKIDKKEITSHRILLNKEKLEKAKIEIKRKRKPEFEKNNKRKRVLNQIEKNNYKVERQLGIINGKLNICFDVNRENKEINDKDKDNDNDKEINKTPEKKFKDEDDFIVLKMSNERKRISDINKISNKDFIQRIKENEKFIKNNSIIINDSSKRSKSQIIKRKNDKENKKGNFHHKLKLFNMKGVFLNKKKK